MVMVPSGPGAGKPFERSSSIACADGDNENEEETDEAMLPIDDEGTEAVLNDVEVAMLVYVAVVKVGVMVDTKMEEVIVPTLELVKYEVTVVV
jgi:hypothetical protein